MKVFISAGEASGDALGAGLIDALRKRVPGLELFGMGGAQMGARGFRALHDSSEIGVVGLLEVLPHLPRLFRVMGALARAAIAERPDVAVLIDVPDFNIRLAKRLTRAGIPVVFYVGPSVWAWRPGRVWKFKPWIRRLLVLFPFEVPIWKATGVDVVCVGHPLADEIPAPAPESAIEPGRVALLPGSRRSEIARHLPSLLAAAAALHASGKATRFVLPVAPGLEVGPIARAIESSPARGMVDLVLAPAGDPAPRRTAIGKCALVLCASGTATLEVALLGRPQVIVYRVSPLTWIIGRMLARVRHIGLPNLIAGEEVAPELLQGAFTPHNVAAAATQVLARGAAGADLRAVLGPPGSSARAAEAVLSLVGAP